MIFVTGIRQRLTDIMLPPLIMISNTGLLVISPGERLLDPMKIRPGKYTHLSLKRDQLDVLQGQTQNPRNIPDLEVKQRS